MDLGKGIQYIMQNSQYAVHPRTFSCHMFFKLMVSHIQFKLVEEEI